MPAGAAEGDKPFLISSLEPGPKEVVVLRSDAAKIVQDKDKASDGEYCVRVEAGKKDQYNGITVSDKAVLKRFKDYLLLTLDVFNPQAEPIVFGIKLTDTRSTSWGMCHNGSATAAPGR